MAATGEDAVAADSTVAQFSATSGATCSGFVADSSGFIATAGHCVDPAEARAGLVESVLSSLVDDGTLTADTAQQLLSSSASWPVQVTSQTEEVVLPQTVAGAGASRTLPAQVIEYRSADQGDVALLKVVSDQPLASLELAAARPPNGQNLTAAGYPGVVTKATDLAQTDPSQAPTFKTGAASGSQTSNGFPFLQFAAPISQGMSGGPVVDPRGAVVGVVSFFPLDDNGGQAGGFSFASDVTTIHDLLARHRVVGAPTPSDTAFREGVVAHFQHDEATAVSRFDDVLASDPNDPLTQKYRREALAADPNAASLLGLSPIELGLLAAGVLALAVAGWLLVSRLSRTSLLSSGARSRGPTTPGPTTPGPTTPGPTTTGTGTTGTGTTGTGTTGTGTGAGAWWNAHQRGAPGKSAPGRSTYGQASSGGAGGRGAGNKRWWNARQGTPSASVAGQATTNGGSSNGDSSSGAANSPAVTSRCPACHVEYTGVLHQCGEGGSRAEGTGRTPSSLTSRPSGQWWR